MRPTTETLKNPKHLPEIGSGLYANAYLQADGTVLKISSGTDGTMDYIEWCLLRLKKFGLNSPEMHGLPEVMHFGRTEHGWWAVMPRYVPSNKIPGYHHNSQKTVDAVKKLLKKTFGKDREGDVWFDLHPGNFMWDESRKSWVVTDPFADTATGTASSLPQPTRFKVIAAWKRQPLQNLFHRHQ